MAVNRFSRKVYGESCLMPGCVTHAPPPNACSRPRGILSKITHFVRDGNKRSKPRGIKPEENEAALCRARFVAFVGANEFAPTYPQLRFLG